MRFYDKVNGLCAQHGISIKALAVKLGFSKGTPTNWKTMTRSPRNDSIKKIADYFHVPISFLTDDGITDPQAMDLNNGVVGDTYVPLMITNSDMSAEEETELLRIFRKLGVIKRAQLLVMAAKLLED